MPEEKKINVEAEEEHKLSSGSLETFYVLDEGNIFGIAFDKIFNQKGIEVYDDFNLKSKRNFKNIANEILLSYQELFLDEKENFKSEGLLVVLYNILDAKYKLMLGSVSYDDFLKMIDKITDSEDYLLTKEISKHVEANYALNLDEITKQTIENKKRVNQELQFTDSHAKALLKISYLYRLMIPIVSEYFTFNKDNFAKTEADTNLDDYEDLMLEDANANVFAYLFEKFAEDADALRNKLYKLVYSRVARTAYSDKRFWSAAKNVAITKDSVTLEIYRKLLTNAIPKLSLDADKNIISFFQSVTNNQIDFLFQNKFKHRYQPIGGQNYERYSDSDDDVSEYERLEILMLRKDEGIHKLRMLNIKKTLNDLPRKLEVEVTDQEIIQLTKTLQRHQVQERILSMFSMKYFKDKQALKFLSFFEYCKLLLICKKYLIKHKFIIIPMILTANCERHRERTTISGKKVRPLIENSKKYDTLFETKYQNFPEEIEKPLSAIIGTTYSSIFKDENGDELFDSSVKVAKVADELIDLAYLV